MPTGSRFSVLGSRFSVLGSWFSVLSIGALVYLYLPLRAAAHPPVNWGDPHDWAGFWWAVSGRPYRQLAFGVEPVSLRGRAAAWASLLGQQFGWAGLALGFVGLLYGARHDRRFIWLACALAALYSAFALGYDTSDSYTYLIPVYLIFAVWIGLGASAVLDGLARRRPRLAPLGAALLLAALLWRLPATAAQVDASADRRAIDFATRALAQAPAQAIVLTQSDRDTFALWYAHYALGQRPDLAVIAEPLLEFGWYRENLRSVYPALQAPDRPGGAWPTALAAANPARGPICRTNPDGAIALVCEPR